MEAVKLFQRIEQSRPLDFGAILSQSIELFKKVWVQGFVHLLLGSVIIVPLILLIYIPMAVILGFGAQAGYMLGDYSAYQNSHTPFDSLEVAGLSIGIMILFFVLVTFVIMLASVVQYALMAHFFVCCKQVDSGEPVSSSYFMFFKKKYLKTLLLLSLATLGMVFAAILLCFFPLLYISIPLQFVLVMFAFNPDLSASDILRASFKYGNKVWFIAFGLSIVASLLAQTIGMMLCFVGIFFTASFINLPRYYMYKDGVGFEGDASGIQQINQEGL